MSGFLVGEEYMNGNAVALDVNHGKGHVLLFGYQPQWRGQSMGTFRTLFNALLYANDLPKIDREVSEDWRFIPSNLDKDKSNNKDVDPNKK